MRAGEVVGLLGANGAGKTTLIRLLLGLLRPTSGRVLLFGRPPSRETRGRLGYVPQGLGLWEDLTRGREPGVLGRGLRRRRRRRSSRTSRPPPARSSATCRSGLRRRLAFAAALAHEPELLVLDEPTSGVGLGARAALWETVHRAAAGGAGVLVTTHHLDEAGECDRLVLMAGGRVVAEGTLAGIVGDGTAVAVARRPLGRRLRRARARPASRPPSSGATCACPAATSPPSARPSTPPASTADARPSSPPPSKRPSSASRSRGRTPLTQHPERTPQ